MCPHCRAFITDSERICPYCEAEVGPRAIDRRRAADAMAGLLEGDRFITTLILLINAGLFVMTLIYSSGGQAIGTSPSYGALRAFGAKDGYAILVGLEWWRLVTAGFLHGGLLHIAMNSWVLWGLGPRVNEVFGPHRYLVIYFLSTVAGFGASLFWTPGALSIGASAGISGLVGAMIGLGTREKHTIIGAERSQYIQWMALILIQGFIIPGIDNAAHIGGFLGGFVVAYLAGSRGYARRIDRFWSTLAWVSVAITGYAFFRMAEHLLRVRL
jgi:rhomboid protease GluP